MIKLTEKFFIKRPKRRYYNLYATEGFINLPNDLTGTGPRTKVYVVGFVGGLVRTEEIDFDGTPIPGTTKTYNPQFENTKENRERLRGTAVIPGPVISGDVGDEIYMSLTNLGMPLAGIDDPHTIHTHGGHVATQVDGFPETSFGVPETPIGADEPITITYFYKATHPGTFMYHCHVEASEHVQLGMYGSFIIYPSYLSLFRAGIVRCPITGKWFYKGSLQPQIPDTATNRNFALNNINTYFDSEWIHLFSDIDSKWHNYVLTGGAFNAVDYKPDYWLVNGRAFPDTLLPTKLPEHLEPDYGYSIPEGYESYVKVNLEDKFLIRMANISYQPVPWHTHGWHGTIVAKDTNPRIADPNNPGIERAFTVLVGSGETYDVLFDASDKRDEYANYIFCGQGGFPPLMEQVARAAEMAGEENIWENIPLANGLGKGDFLPPYNWAVWNYGSGTANNFFFPQFYPAHNHDDYKVTNNGTYPGGQLTLIETDFPGSDYTASPPVITEPAWECPITIENEKLIKENLSEADKKLTLEEVEELIDK
ncbi:MAG: hypothetical protein PWR10_1075 [Halanaerobiales bacterium]|nr:hypothetical protein [Halanaerobiales bacterium]